MIYIETTDRVLAVRIPNVMGILEDAEIGLQFHRDNDTYINATSPASMTIDGDYLAISFSVPEDLTTGEWVLEVIDAETGFVFSSEVVSYNPNDGAGVTETPMDVKVVEYNPEITIIR